MTRPQKPKKGLPSITSLYRSICEIIDYLPTLEIIGDNKKTWIQKTGFGSIIHVKDSATITNETSSSTIVNEGTIAKVETLHLNNGMLTIKATLYPQGKNGKAGKSISVISLNYGVYETIKPDDWIIVYPGKVNVVGGNE